MSSLLNFERAKFGVIYVETAAARKEVSTSLLEEAWASLEVTKTAPEEALVEVKAVFEEFYSDYFTKEGTPAQGNQIYVWDSWNLFIGFDKILQQVKAMANCEIEALRAREKSVGSWLVSGMTVATEVQTPPANVSYNTQGALNELPLDVSNVMNESDGNVEWRALHPN
ncbi:hypothetical protein DSO57_1031437 [Entomophthora muscae]|uniref:Uncharacterized protein n=1 Tax=Entomophthora muscae TaxID=34485 RepID=A0ACC2SPT2_9FUNG|nr:hypothetical protein DSO57_1031437 [Entomophthora muscae]